MTPRPNSLFHWIPLLCLIWTVPARAQVWTTVWTPDSTPAIRTTGADGGTHESKTNCYPCKEWEDYGDGTGKWVKYPEGTEPVICVGDDTDYSCLECDGEGEIQNKKDGSPCMTYEFVPKAGCCRDGECEVGWPIMTVRDLEECPSLSPRANYTPTPSDPACGPAVGSIPALPSMFDDCCIDHDECYGTCNRIKQNCDEALVTRMIGVADRLAASGNYPAAGIAYLCIEPTSDFFNSGIISNGRFTDAQIRACICCEGDPDSPWEDYPWF